MVPVDLDKTNWVYASNTPVCGHGIASDLCCTMYLVVLFTLDLGVQRTHRQSARRLTQPVNGNNFLLLVDTSIHALQGVRLPPV